MANNELKEIFTNIIKLAREAREQAAEDLLMDFAMTLTKEQREIFYDCIIETKDANFMSIIAIQVPDAPMEKLQKAIVKYGTFPERLSMAHDCIMYKKEICEELKESILTAPTKDVQDLSKFDLITLREVVEVINPCQDENEDENEDE